MAKQRAIIDSYNLLTETAVNISIVYMYAYIIPEIGTYLMHSIIIRLYRNNIKLWHFKNITDWYNNYTMPKVLYP